MSSTSNFNVPASMRSRRWEINGRKKKRRREKETPFQFLAPIYFLSACYAGYVPSTPINSKQHVMRTSSAFDGERLSDVHNITSVFSVETSGVPNEHFSQNWLYDVVNTSKVLLRQPMLIFNFPGKKIPALPAASQHTAGRFAYTLKQFSVFTGKRCHFYSSRGVIFTPTYLLRSL